MLRKVSKMLIALLVVLAIAGCGKKGGKEVEILVYDREKNKIYNESVSTDEEFLLGVLKENEDLKVVTEDGEYGEFVTSILDNEQGDDYYWNFYVNGVYASEGVSTTPVNDGDKYTFSLEKFE